MAESKHNGQGGLSGDVYYPGDEVVAEANVPDYESQVKRATDDLEGFWAERAEELEWYEKWEKVLDESDAPFYKWFVGAKTNIVHNALDKHMHMIGRIRHFELWDDQAWTARCAELLASLGDDRAEVPDVLKNLVL